MSADLLDGGGILYIDPSWSYCGTCGQMADPYQDRHRTVPPGMTMQPVKPGCQVHFLWLSSHYTGRAIREAAQKMRPDLPWQPRMLGEDA